MTVGIISIELRLRYMQDDPFEVMDVRKSLLVLSGTVVFSVCMEGVMVHDWLQLAFMAILESLWKILSRFIV
jgi:hypothetical protein